MESRLRLREHEGRELARDTGAMVVDAVEHDRYWIFPHDDFLDLAIDRWARVAERLDPEPIDLPGMPSRAEMLAELQKLLGLAPG